MTRNASFVGKFSPRTKIAHTFISSIWPPVLCQQQHYPCSELRVLCGNTCYPMAKWHSGVKCLLNYLPVSSCVPTSYVYRVTILPVCPTSRRKEVEDKQYRQSLQWPESNNRCRRNVLWLSLERSLLSREVIASKQNHEHARL